MSRLNLGANLLGSAGFSGSVLSPLGAMANAAAAGLSTQAAVALANNKGNISAALNDLSSSATVKQLLTSALTAGALSKVLTMPGMESLGTVANDPAFMERLVGRVGTSLVESTVSATVDTAINGGSLTDKLDLALINGLANALQGTVAGEIKGLESGSLDTDYVLHKIAHAAAGCVAGEITQKACEAGAIGAGVGEMVAGLFPKPTGTLTATQQQEYDKKVIAMSQLAAGAIASLAGYDTATAISTADTAIKNNYLTSSQVYALKTELIGCNTSADKNACIATVDSKYMALSNIIEQGIAKKQVTIAPQEK